MGASSGFTASSEGMMGAERPSLLEEDEDLSASSTGSRIPPLPPLDDLTPKIH
jgi:hypothetical protein